MLRDSYNKVVSTTETLQEKCSQGLRRTNLTYFTFPPSLTVYEMNLILSCYEANTDEYPDNNTVHVYLKLNREETPSVGQRDFISCFL